MRQRIFLRITFVLWSVFMAWGAPVYAGHSCDEAAHPDLKRSVHLAWDENGEPDIIGYRVYSRSDENLTCVEDVGFQNEYLLSGLGTGGYIFWVTAYNTEEVESLPSSSLVLDPVIVRDQTSPLLSNVQVSTVTQNGAIIVWTTDEPATSQVDYGPSATYGLSSAKQTEYVTSHRVELKSLLASLPYFYRVVSQDRSGNEASSVSLHTFTTTAPPPPSPPPPTPTPPPPPAPALSVISDLKVKPISGQRVQVSWRTNTPTTSQMAYGLFQRGRPEVVKVQKDGGSALVTNHLLTSAKMKSERAYFFRVTNKRPGGGIVTERIDFQFRKKGRKFYVLIIR
jgi:hypothetical protein